jgi:hypothetical protein
MSVDEARRLLLHDAARTAWGAEAALVLMEMLPPTGWSDVATRQQLGVLEERIELRLNAFEARMDAKLERWGRRMIQWSVGTMITMTGVFAVVTRLG